MTPDANEFHMEEFRQLHGDFAALLKSNLEMMRFAGAGSVGVFIWLATHPPIQGSVGVEAFQWAWYLPALTSVFAGVASTSGSSAPRRLGTT